MVDLLLHVLRHMSQVFDSHYDLVKHVIYLLVILLEQLQKALFIFIQVAFVFFLFVSDLVKSFKFVLKKDTPRGCSRSRLHDSMPVAFVGASRRIDFILFTLYLVVLFVIHLSQDTQILLQFCYAVVLRLTL